MSHSVDLTQIGLSSYLKNTYQSFPEKFSATTGLIRWIDLIPILDQISCGVRLGMAATELGDALLCGGKTLFLKISKKGFDVEECKRAYYQVAMCGARVLRSVVTLGVFPFGSFATLGINKIILLAWNLFGSLDSPLVPLKEDEGWSYTPYIPFTFRKGPIFRVGLLFPYYGKKIANGDYKDLIEHFKEKVHKKKSKKKSQKDLTEIPLKNHVIVPVTKQKDTVTKATKQQAEDSQDKKIGELKDS